jgi:hypothetical protein
MRKQVLAMIVGLACAPAAQAEPPAFTHFESDRPLQEWAIAYRGPDLICYEGSATVGDGVALDTKISDAASAVLALNASAYPVDFELRTLGSRRLLVATDSSPLLDTRISLTPKERVADEALLMWAEALSAQTGQRLLLGESLKGEATTDAGGTNVVARELLAEILDDHGSNKVWYLMWFESEQSWVLEIAKRWDLEPKPLPPVPTVWHSQPPGTPIKLHLPPSFLDQ